MITTRNLDSATWNEATIRSVIERGDLPQWKEMFAAGAADPAVAEKIVRVAKLPEGTPIDECSPPEVLASILAPLKFPAVKINAA